jgi:hypothetical protein
MSMTKLRSLLVLYDPFVSHLFALDDTGKFPRKREHAWGINVVNRNAQIEEEKS